MTTTRLVTMQELATHKTLQTGVWLAIHGRVLDVSKFITNAKHPGGEEPLFDNAGTDATQAFEDNGHSETAHGMLENEPDVVFVGMLDGYKPLVKEKPKSGGGVLGWIFGT